MQKKIIILLSAFFILQPNAFSKCTNAELRTIEMNLDGAADMTSIYRNYKKIEKCQAMNGGIADGFNDIANRLLADHLQEIYSSSHLTDKSFEMALIKSISEGTEINTFQKIYANAKSCIPKPFCKKVAAHCKEIQAYVKKIQQQHKQ